MKRKIYSEDQFKKEILENLSQTSTIKQVREFINKRSLYNGYNAGWLFAVIINTIFQTDNYIGLDLGSMPGDKKEFVIVKDYKGGWNLDAENVTAQFSYKGCFRLHKVDLNIQNKTLQYMIGE